MRRGLIGITLALMLLLAGCFSPVVPEDNNGNGNGNGNGGGDVPQLTKYVQQTEIPKFKITTQSPIESKFEYVDAVYEIESENQDYLLEVDGEIRLRGNYTQTLDKKPYRLKFAEKRAPLGMDSSKSWALIADATDFSLMRNYLGYTFAENIMGYNLRARYVEVYLNDAYQGLYMLMDNKSADEDRIPIIETGDVGTGYMFELDNRAIGGDSTNIDDPNVVKAKEYCLAEGIVFGENAFYCNGFKNVVLIKDPEPLTQQQFSAIKKYVTDAANSLTGGGFTTYFDMDALARYYIVQELWYNTDVGSVYLYRESGEGKLKMGPVWDLDLSLGISKILAVPGTENKYDEWYYREISDIYSALKDKTAFKTALKNNWNAIYQTEVADLKDGIDEVMEMLEPYQQKNFQRWDSIGKGVYVDGEPRVEFFFTDEYMELDSWSAHAQAVKAFLINRIEWFNVKVNLL